MSNQETPLGQAILVENQVSYLTVHFLWGGKLNFTLEKLNTVGIWNPDQSGFQMIKNGCKWSGSEVRNPNQLKSGQMAAILSKPFEIRKKSRFWMVQFLNVWDWSISQRWSPIIWKPDHLKSDPQKVGFQIPNVQGLYYISTRESHPCKQNTLFPMLLNRIRVQGLLVYSILRNMAQIQGLYRIITKAQQL